MLTFKAFYNSSFQLQCEYLRTSEWSRYEPDDIDVVSFVSCQIIRGLVYHVRRRRFCVKREC